ncbi:unnamed protein product [Spirodela intermedia]|uniref:Uncharacterized protein n=1 Tax=Spirodela intermedia TaxID=51605 RepID=A0A7I8J2A4_SPIIN|nr:unnamed protein product [Spirodela intermedia]CAA6664189.1 unnamed protein product [Spirodela intermedia]
MPEWRCTEWILLFDPASKVCFGRGEKCAVGC